MSALKLSRQEGVGIVALARPPMNAMDAALLEELADVFAKFADDPSIQAAVITGDGQAFSAGLDLKVVPGLDITGQHRLITALNACFGALYGWPKPLVAAVNGHAIAGGLILALCADRRLVADVPMQVSLAEVRVGVTYPVSALDVARYELTPAAARRLVLLGETLDARGAVAWGVFDQEIPADELLPRAVDAARRDARLAPTAFKTIKKEMREPALARIAAALAGHGEPRYANWLTEETRRAAAAALRSTS